MRHVSGLGPKHYAARDPDRRGPTLRSSTSDTFFSHTVLRVPGIPLSNGKYYFYSSTSTATTNSTTSTTTTTSSTTSTYTANFFYFFYFDFYYYNFYFSLGRRFSLSSLFLSP